MKLKIPIVIILIIPVLFSCQIEKKISEYPANIGDIEFNPDSDNKDYNLCFGKHIFQYFNYTSEPENYKGEKIEIDKIFFMRYKNQNIPNETGLIRIRFVVNCKSETDRFRVIGVDENYNPKKFDNKITSQLLMIAKGLDGWIPKKIKDHEVDYYQYLIFKIENGNLIEIMP
ncbi:hypothetical protein J2786_002384 [Chryseobacterium vietnamense]|uniref:Uncharacterized protein n=1 Tax=Chryseobacterium vietnamense TaxID=866785 RepID=A0ACC6J928_9FLAO|nr:hypothetical protein [Chryseobacterium vietnamense]MDR6459277.1 hypothetical protein [Chryseobacterium vietnamense]